MSGNTTEYGYTTTEDLINQQEGRTRTSWNTRNNSSNVSGILNTEIYKSEEDSYLFTGSKKHVVVSNHCYKAARLPKFYCDGCYCRKSPVYPKLAFKQPGQRDRKLKKPKCKITGTCCINCSKGNTDQHERHSETSIESNSSLEDTKGFSEDTRIDKTGSPQPRTKKTQDNTSNKHVSSKQNRSSDKPLNFFNKKHVGDQEVPESSKSEKSKKKPPINTKKKRKSLQVPNSSDYYSSTVTSILQNEKDEALEEDRNVDKTSDPNPNNLPTNEDLKELNTFRKDNYFDCFSTGNLSGEKEADHNCVHKFILNDRLIPQPLYADGFGTSRCTKCDKAIKPDVLNSNKDKNFKEDTTRYQIHVSKSGACCVGHQPKHKINISAKNDRIEIKVPISSSQYNELFNTSFKIKNPASANSLALRHQKGVV